MFTDLYGKIRESQDYIYPVLLPLSARVSPACRYAHIRGKVGFIMCSLTQGMHFLSCLVSSKPNIPISSLDFDRMKRRKIVRYDPQVEELDQTNYITKSSS